MQRSFRACVRNLPALIVFFVLTMIAAFAIYFMAMLLGFVVRLLAGDLAMQVVLQLVSMAVLMPVLTGAMYHAWRQMLGGDATAASDPVVGGFEA
jgi:uncharacterized membrane protein